MEKPINSLKEEIESYISEARKLLPKLPYDLTFTLDKNLIIPGNGTGGTLLQPTILGIGYDSHFGDKELLSKNLRASVLHECYHAMQGWSDQNPMVTPETLLEDGVLEGVAVVFERDFGGTSPLWASYEEEEVMQKWLNEIKSLELDPNSEQYFDYKFGEVGAAKWMLYKLGTWIADKALERNTQLTIIDLSTKTSKEIIQLANIN